MTRPVSPITNEDRRQIMQTAWGFRRDEPARAFADCLRGAWKFVRGMAKAAAAFVRRARRSGGRVALSPSLTQSPIQRATATMPHHRRTDFSAAYLTASIGG